MVKKTSETKSEAVSDRKECSQKLDAMLKDAKIDGELMSSLGNIKILNQLQKYCSTAESMASKYSEELTWLPNGILNSLYKVQLQRLQEMHKSMKRFLKIT
jgi:hypothetical protein